MGTSNLYYFNKNFYLMNWNNFFDSKFIFKHLNFFFFFLKNILNNLFNEFFFFIKKKKVKLFIFGHFWIYLYQTFFILNLNFFNFKNKKKFKKKRFIFYFNKFFI